MDRPRTDQLPRRCGGRRSARQPATTAGLLGVSDSPLVLLQLSRCVRGPHLCGSHDRPALTEPGSASSSKVSRPSSTNVAPHTGDRTRAKTVN